MDVDPEVDFAAIIRAAADDVERTRDVHVTPAARSALLLRVEQHRDAALEEIRTRRTTLEGIHGAAVAQLTDAIGIAESTPHLDFFIDGEGETRVRSVGTDALDLSMEWKCHWIPWC